MLLTFEKGIVGLFHGGQLSEQERASRDSGWRSSRCGKTGCAEARQIKRIVVRLGGDLPVPRRIERVARAGADLLDVHFVRHGFLGSPTIDQAVTERIPGA